MAVEHNAYRRALQRARARGLALARRQARELEETFLRVLARLETLTLAGEGVDPITATRARAAQDALRPVLARMQARFDQITRSGASATVSDVVTIHRDLMAELTAAYPSAGAGLVKKLGGTNARALAAAARLPGAANFATVYGRHLQKAVPAIDTMIAEAAFRGVSSGDLTRDLLRVMTANEPGLLARLPSSSVLHKGGFGRLDLGKYGMTQGEVGAVRTMLYDARRIAVTSTNNALREANRHSMMDAGLVIAAKWQLSGRHPEPDACDVLAEADVYGYGPGMYPPERWPEHPHPHCACSQGGPVRMQRPSEWGKAKPPVSNPSLRNIRGRVADLGGTDARRAGQLSMVVAAIRV